MVLFREDMIWSINGSWMLSFSSVSVYVCVSSHSRPKQAILGVYSHHRHKPHTSAQAAQPAHTAPQPVPAELTVGAEKCFRWSDELREKTS